MAQHTAWDRALQPPLLLPPPCSSHQPSAISWLGLAPKLGPVSGGQCLGSGAAVLAHRAMGLRTCTDRGRVRGWWRSGIEGQVGAQVSILFGHSCKGEVWGEGVDRPPGQPPPCGLRLPTTLGHWVGSKAVEGSAGGSVAGPAGGSAGRASISQAEQTPTGEGRDGDDRPD